MIIDKSENLGELFGALSLAQGEMGGAKKTSDNPFFCSKYADLAECLNTTKDTFAKYGLSVTQHLGNILAEQYNVTKMDKNGLPYVEVSLVMKQEVYTILGHKSGQFVMSCGQFLIGKQDIQGQGSSCTYGRRYAFSAAVGIAQEDDDGNSNVTPPASYVKKKALEKTIEEVKNTPNKLPKGAECNNSIAEIDAGTYCYKKGGIGYVHIAKDNKDMQLGSMNSEQLQWVLKQPWTVQLHNDVKDILEHVDVEMFK